MKWRPLIQGSAEWSDARLAIPTASQFHRIITPKEMKLSKSADGYLCELLAEWVLGYGVVDAESGFMDRGKDMEIEARHYYELQREADLLPGGFFLTEDERAGASPDGCVGDEGLVEIKCLSAPKHIGYLLYGPGVDYRAQVQGQLLISGRAWVDFVAYSPVLPSRIIRYERDEEFIARLRLALTQFCENLDAARKQLAEAGVEGQLPPARGLGLVA